MSVSNRIETIKRKRGVGLCPCQSENEFPHVVTCETWEGEPERDRPLDESQLQYCPLCGECTSLIIKIRYTDELSQKIKARDESEASGD